MVERLKRFLDLEEVRYEVFPHPEAYEAVEVARRSHVPARRLAKVIVLHTSPNAWQMLVLPASEHLDHDITRRVTGHDLVRFASDDELSLLFPDCEVGAAPPFGKLWGLTTVIDACFERDEEEEGADDFYFQAGNHRELARVSFRDYRRIAGPFARETCLHVRPKTLQK